MRRKCLVVLTLVAAAGATVQASAGVGFGRTQAHATRIPCRPGPGTTTIAHSATARIFSDDSNGNDYACLYSNGHARYLSTTEHYEYRLVRFAGSYVGFVANIEAIDDHVGVMDLRTGRLHNYQEVSPISRAVCPQVDSLVLKSDGAVAWIATNFLGSGCSNPPCPAIEVRRHDRRGLRIIGHGTGIVPTSLHLSGSVLHWTDAGQMRSATLF
jgi:hypothetical protein